MEKYRNKINQRGSSYVGYLAHAKPIVYCTLQCSLQAQKRPIPALPFGQDVVALRSTET